MKVVAMATEEGVSDDSKSFTVEIKERMLVPGS